ncbi:MAG: penicillin-binding protein activator [Pseudomonadota bacterium]|nr:penicillin-binding protein activator [Pseudomonadota bacterium]
MKGLLRGFSALPRLLPRLPSILLPVLLLCAAAPPMPDPVQKALEMKNRMAGAELLEDSRGEVGASELPWLLLYAGELRRLAGDLPGARAHFEAVAGDHPTSHAKEPAVLGMAVVDAKEAASGNTLATLELIGDKGVPDSLNADRYLLLARAKAAEGAPSDIVRTYGDKAVHYAADQKDVAKRVGKAMETLWEAPPAPPASKDPPDLLAIAAIRAAVAEGDLDTVGTLSATFAERFGDSPFAREAGYAARRAASGTRTDPGLVAVLLPLTGNYALPAESLRAAIELGNKHAGGTLRLAFFDTGGTAEKCVNALEQATLKQGASLVIGPLLKEESLECASTAQALRVPLLTLTSSEEVLSAGDQVYRAFPSTEQLVEALLAETFDVRAMKRYAIVNPTTPFGENAARIFAEAVVARGGIVPARAAYDPEQKDFRVTAKALGKKDYKARSGEYEQLKRDAERSKQDPKKVVLPPLIDYDAIFIPDSYQRVALLASALAFEEFPVGRFKAHRDDASVVLLGLNAWNNDELARRGGTYVQDSIFVDAFDARVDDASTDAFLSAWHERDKGEPTVVEAAAYDTARLVAAIVAAGGDRTAALQSARLTGPVAGTLGFGPDRQLARTWRLLTVTREGVRPLTPPEPVDAGQ